MFDKNMIVSSLFQVSFSIDRILNCSDIDGMSPNNTYGFDHTYADVNDAKALHIVSFQHTLSRLLPKISSLINTILYY